MTIPMKLIEKRKSAGLSQNKLAKLAGISQSDLNGIERGRSGLGLKRARMLAAALGCPVADLID